MAQVLCLSSYVARGHIGLQAIVPALQGLGHEAIALPTVMLSNHPGHSHCARLGVPATHLMESLCTYQDAGWLPSINAVLSGYLPTVDHAGAVKEIVRAVRAANPDAVFVCDPVLGDDPDGLYIHADAATAIRDQLVPIADWLTPNRFELAWLSGLPVADVSSAIAAARHVKARSVLVTSVPVSELMLGNLLIEPGGGELHQSARLDHVPHGTGDFLAALFLGHLLNGHGPRQALHCAAAGADAVARRSQGLDELNIVADKRVWIDPVLLPA